MTAENGNPSTSDWEPYSHLLIDGGNPVFNTVPDGAGVGRIVLHEEQYGARAVQLPGRTSMARW